MVRSSTLALFVLTAFAADTHAEDVIACQSRELLAGALGADGGLPEDCRPITVRRVASEPTALCVISFEVDAGLIGAVTDVPDEWWTACENLAPTG